MPNWGGGGFLTWKCENFVNFWAVIFLIEGVHETYMKLLLGDKVECYVLLCEVSWPSVIAAKCRPTFCT